MATKVSISLTDEDRAFLDSEVAAGSAPSRSAAVHAAIQSLRESRLTDAYAEAYATWDESEDAGLWETTANDGLA